MLVRFQKGLLRRVQIGAVEGRPASHRAHGEYLDLGALVAEVDPGLIPVTLRFLRPTVTLRHECLPPQKTHLMFALTDVVAHRRLSERDVGKLRQNTAIQPPGGVALLTRCRAVLIEHLVDEVCHRAQLRLGPDRVAVLRRQCTADRLAHDAPMNTELRGNTRDRTNTKFMLPTKLLE